MVTWYCIIFYVLMLYKFFNGLFLFQVQPAFFYTREDIVTWLFMQTGLHKWLLNDEQRWLLFDFLFYTAPLFYFIVERFNQKQSGVAAVILLLINFCYLQCYTLYPTNSIEGSVAWLLFPVAFIATDAKTFQLLFQGLRYFFLFLIASAGLWKLIQGGAFNLSEMSGILLFQHKELIYTSPNFWQTKLIVWLINHQGISYLLYLLVTMVELIFIIGFFTKRYDKLLAALFIVFLLADHLIMRIPYYELTPFLLTLLCSRKLVTNP